MTDTGWAQLGLFATTVAGFGYSAWREKRSREWATLDRAAATAQIVAVAKANAEALHIKTEAEAAALRITTAAAAKLIASKIDGVHQAADAAWKEANDVNLKIANFNQRLIEQAPKTAEKLTELQGTAADIQTTVERIDSKVGP